MCQQLYQPLKTSCHFPQDLLEDLDAEVMTCRRSPTTNPALARLRLSPVRCFGPTFGTPGNGRCREPLAVAGCSKSSCTAGRSSRGTKWISRIGYLDCRSNAAMFGVKTLQERISRWMHLNISIAAFKRLKPSKVQCITYPAMGLHGRTNRAAIRNRRKVQMTGVEEVKDGQLHYTDHRPGAQHPQDQLERWWNVIIKLSNLCAMMVTCLNSMSDMLAVFDCHSSSAWCHVPAQSSTRFTSSFGGWGLLTLPRSFLRRTNSFVENGVLKIVASCEVCRQEVA